MLLQISNCIMFLSLFGNIFEGALFLKYLFHAILLVNIKKLESEHASFLKNGNNHCWKKIAIITMFCCLK